MQEDLKFFKSDTFENYKNILLPQKDGHEFWDFEIDLRCVQFLKHQLFCSLGCFVISPTLYHILELDAMMDFWFFRLSLSQRNASKCWFAMSTPIFLWVNSATNIFPAQCAKSSNISVSYGNHVKGFYFF